MELTPLFLSDKYIQGLFTYALTLHIQTFQVKILKESILLLFTALNRPSHATFPMKVDKCIARVLVSYRIITWFHLFVQIHINISHLSPLILQ